MTELTNQNFKKTMSVMNDPQLSKDFDGPYHAKDFHLSALLPRVIHNITFSVVLSIYFAKKTNEIKDTKTLFVYIFTGVHAFGTPRQISGSRYPNDVIQ